MHKFEFGHPCEHQLHRTCIGGQGCPLNGYPKEWCCSFIKGKINFKRDKPCEGNRCRWNYTHPSAADFEVVTGLIAEARAIASRIDATEAAVESYPVPAAHAVDVLHAAVQYSRHLGRSPHPFHFGRLVAHIALRLSSADVVAQLGRLMLKHPNGEEMACGLVDHVLANPVPFRDTRHETVRIVVSLLGNGTCMVDRAHQGAVQTAYVRCVAAHLRGKKRLEALDQAAHVLRHYDDAELARTLTEEVLTTVWQPAVAKARTSPPATMLTVSAPPSPATPERPVTFSLNHGAIGSPVFSMPSPILLGVPFTPPMPRFGPLTPFASPFGGTDGLLWATDQSGIFGRTDGILSTGPAVQPPASWMMPPAMAESTS